MRSWRKFAGVSLTAGLVLIISAFGALPVMAAAGDVWTQPAGTAEETPSGGSEESHMPCGAVDIWAKDLDQATGTWTLYHQSPPSPTDTYLAGGTYDNWSGDHHLIATIPMATFHLGTGPHFKVEVQNGNNKKSKVFWVDCKIGISTTPNPSSAPIGAKLNDTATLSNGFSPTGTITFELFDPSGTLAYTNTVAVNGNGTYSTAPGGPAANAVGTWQWKATYSGNDGNDGVSSKLGDEPVVVAKAEPTISTTTSPEVPRVGDTLKDSASLSGAYNPTGTITFTLYDSSDTVVYTEDASVSGSDATTAKGYVAAATGDFYWRAEYSGDTNNKSVLSAKEPLTVGREVRPAQPDIITTPNPATGVVGATFKDTATLSGGNDPTGHITFTLYDPADLAVHSEDVTVNGNGDYTTPAGFVANVTGAWHWEAEYSGDTGNLKATSADEPVTVNKAEPTISTTPSPASAEVGDSLKDTATLSHGYHPTGTITFTLVDPAGHEFGTPQTVTVSGNGSYTTPTGYAAGQAGTWYWTAAYSGDANNKGATSGATEEPVEVSEGWHPAQPAISTTPSATEAPIGTTLKDIATLSGGSDPTGHITFTLYKPNGDEAYTEAVDVHGNGAYTTPAGHVADGLGTWHWKAVYGGDEANRSVASNPEDEAVVVEPATPAITTTPTPSSTQGVATLKDKATLSDGYHPTGTITFTLYDPSNNPVHTEQVVVDGNGDYTTPQGHSAETAGTWHWKAAYSGDENNLAVASDPADEPVTVTGAGEVLAATGSTPPGMTLALLLLASGGIAVLAALALRRRQA